MSQNIPGSGVSSGAGGRKQSAAEAATTPDELKLWRAHGANWRQIFGSFRQLGVSFEWHELPGNERIDWARSFHPDSLELCLNLKGPGMVKASGVQSDFQDGSVGFYYAGFSEMEAWREAGDPHLFITVEFSPSFLAQHLLAHVEGLHPLVAQVVRKQKGASAVAATSRLTSGQQELVRSLQKPPVLAAAQATWYLGKALELASAFFFQPPPEAELFCHRQQHVATERVQKVIQLLKEHLAEPLSLEELGKRVGCSPFYLSRTFSREMGMTIPQYLRQLRMDKAAELLRGGKHNVTEAAMEVGYNSLSHFSHAFHQTFGCCPGLYPTVKPSKPKT